MKKQIGKITYSIILIVLLAACVPAAATIEPTLVQPTIDLNPVYTAAVQTYEVESTRKAALIPTATETPAPTATLALPTATPGEIVAMGTPMDTPTLWIPVSGSSYPTINAIYDTNCRTGPDKVFEVVGALRVGETSDVYGRLRGGGWWLIKNITHDDPKYCWVWAESTKVTGSIDMVPYITAPPTPVVSKPVVTAAISVVPATSLVCPTTFVFTGTITSDRETILNYKFVLHNGDVMDSGTVEFLDDGTQTVTLTKVFNGDITGWMQLKIDGPMTTKSGKANFSLDCP